MSGELISPGPGELVEPAPRELIPPGSGAFVMGTGIVSVGLATAGFPVLSDVLLAIACLAWLALAAVAVVRLLVDRGRVLSEARSPAGLTAVAGTAVLGSRMLELGWGGVAIALLGIAVAAWISLMGLTLPRLPGRASGQVFMVVVGTEALSSLGASLALSYRSVWLTYAALVLAAAGVLAYPLVLARFRLRELWQGAGDQWVAGGSLAISSLAVAQVAHAVARVHAAAGAASALKGLALGIWIAAAVWIIALVAGELHRRRLSYGVQRWATVFPLGMYSVSAFSVAAVAGVPALTGFARVWVWVALAGWAAALTGMLRRGWEQRGLIGRRLARPPIGANRLSAPRSG
jgi:tellurite resistance protein TehA-like permease